MDEISKEVQNRIDALPPDIKALVYSADMASIIQEIGKKNQLHIDQTGALEAEAAAVMIGITKPEEFVQNVAEALNVSEQKSAAVAKDVNELLFLKIRDSMKKIPERKTAPTPSTAPISSAPPAPAFFKPPMPVPPPPATPIPPPSSPAPQSPPVPVSPAPPVLPTSPSASAASTAKPEPPKPPAYKIDPYREPPE